MIFQFLSTLPARGATLHAQGQLNQQSFLSTLPARGATRSESGISSAESTISIHAPREGSDLLDADIEDEDDIFLSTLPARGATGSFPTTATPWNISIHAPREGSDVLRAAGADTADISIHAPREGSDYDYLLASRYLEVFLSTLPARGATSPPSPA